MQAFVLHGEALSQLPLPFQMGTGEELPYSLGCQRLPSFFSFVFLFVEQEACLAEGSFAET